MCMADLLMVADMLMAGSCGWGLRGDWRCGPREVIHFRWGKETMNRVCFSAPARKHECLELAIETKEDPDVWQAELCTFFCPLSPSL